MGQISAKPTLGKDNIIRTAGLEKKSFLGGIGAEYFRCMKAFKNEVAQIDAASGRTSTYEELLRKSVRTALEMRSRGIKPKDVVSICSFNHVDTVVPLIATFFLGAIPASLDPTLSLADTKHLMNQVKPKIIFASQDAVKLIEDALRETNINSEVVVFGEAASYAPFSQFLKEKKDEAEFQPFEDVDERGTALILFSSGTTGLPKGICLNHFSLMNQIRFYMDGNTTDVYLIYSSLYWISAIGVLTAAVLHGSARVVDKQFDAQNFFRLVDRFKVSFTFLTVSMCNELCNVGRPEHLNTDSLRQFFTGGERVSTKLLVNLRSLFPTTFVSNGYGQTEVSGLITVFNYKNPEDVRLSKEKLESCGRPVSTIDMYKVVNTETEEALGPNQPGELRVKGPFLMNGYHNMDSSTAYDGEGWLKTGDVAYFDEDFCFYVVDRIKEMLKYRSWHVVPALIEGILLTHPAVSAAVVVGIPDEEDGEHPMACVILKPGVGGVSEEELRKYVDERVDDRKRLRAGVMFLKSFPTTATGKINRRQIRMLHDSKRQKIVA